MPSEGRVCFEGIPGRVCFLVNDDCYFAILKDNADSIVSLIIRQDRLLEVDFCIEHPLLRRW